MQTETTPRLLSVPSDIPDAAVYVILTDTFMSGWGPARNKVNRLVFPCNDAQEADTVAQYANGRSDTADIYITEQRPSVFLKNQLWQLMTPQVAPAWYRGGEA